MKKNPIIRGNSLYLIKISKALKINSFYLILNNVIK